MRGIGIGVEEADRDALAARRAQRGDGGAQRVLVQRAQHRAVGRHAFRHFHAQLARHQRLGAARKQVIDMRAALAADLQQVAEAFGRDQPRARELALQQRVGRDRRAEADEAHLRRVALRQRQDLADALHRRAVGILGRGGELVAQAFARPRVHQEHVGEGAPDIETDPDRARHSAR
jgi:hypothetical protein